MSCWPPVGDDVPILLLASHALHHWQSMLLQAHSGCSRSSLRSLGCRGREAGALGRSRGRGQDRGGGGRGSSGTRNRNWGRFLRLMGHTVCFKQLHLQGKWQRSCQWRIVDVLSPVLLTIECWHTSLRVTRSFSLGSMSRQTNRCFYTNIAVKNSILASFASHNILLLECQLPRRPPYITLAWYSTKGWLCLIQ